MDDVDSTVSRVQHHVDFGNFETLTFGKDKVIW
jgi:hypothetical protein